MTIELGNQLSDLVPNLALGTGLRLYYFMRTADCPVCRQHVKRLVALHGELTRLGVSVVVLAPGDETDTPPSYASALQFPFVVSSAAHEKAGFGSGFGGIQQSGTLVTDGSGTVLYIRRATLPFHAFSEKEVMALFRAREAEGTFEGSPSRA